MTTQPVQSPPQTPVFPIRQFVQIGGDVIVDAVNALIVDINYAIVNAGILGGNVGIPGICSRRQFFAAIAAWPLDVNLLVNAITPDWNNSVTIEFYTGYAIAQGGGLSNLAASTYGLSGAQMTTLFANAATFPV